LLNHHPVRLLPLPTSLQNTLDAVHSIAGSNSHLSRGQAVTRRRQKVPVDELLISQADSEKAYGLSSWDMVEEVQWEAVLVAAAAQPG
jgi:hypothetical protein